MAKGKANKSALKKASKARKIIDKSGNTTTKVKKARRKESYSIYIFKVS